MDLGKQINIVLSYESTKASWRNNHSSAEWKAADRLGKVVGAPLNKSRNCQCVEDLFMVLKLYYRDKNKVKLKQKQIMSKFKLKDGMVLMLHGFTETVTNDNLTDEKAIQILKKYPAHSVSFSEKPSDWKKICAKGLPAAKKDVDPGSGGNGNSAKTREEILLDTDVNVLRKLADDIASKKKIGKASAMCKQAGLTKYILKNESK